MKIEITSRKLFAVAFFIIVITNIIILIGIALNRSAEPQREIILTERELAMPYRSHKENSGLSLELRWRTLGKDVDSVQYYYSRHSPTWFDVKKLKELGFDNIDEYLQVDRQTTNYRLPIIKEVFIVLENNGESYRESLKRAKAQLKKEEDLLELSSDDKRLHENAKEAQKQLEKEKTSVSRLFAIDAGIDPEILSKKYSDQARYIITKGLVKPKYDYHDKKVAGYIKSLSVSSIHVSLRYRQLFDVAPTKNRSNRYIDQSSQKYEVVLAYGSRYEPWIVDIQVK